MDLGFGDSNQVVGDATAKALLMTARAQEEVLDDELARYDELLQSEDVMQKYRLARMKQVAKQQQQEKEPEYYHELDGSSDVAQQFFRASKDHARLVVHFFRPGSEPCRYMHRHLENLSRQHNNRSTAFVSINVQDAAQHQGVAYLVEKLGIVVLPTLVLVRNRKAVHHVRGFDELGGTQGLTNPHFLTRLLIQHDLIEPEDEPNVIQRNKKLAIRRGMYNDDD